MVTFLVAFLTASVFIVAAVAKLRSPAVTEESLRAFALPAWAARVGRTALPVVELATAALLLVPWTVTVGGITALVLLATFSLAIIGQLVSGRRPNCSCFGAASSEPISNRSLVRNGILALPALSVVTGAAAWLDARIAAQPTLAALAGLALITAGLSVLTVLLWQQQAWLQRRIGDLEAKLDSAQPGRRPAPHQTLDLGASLQSLAATETTLGLQLQGAHRALLVFVDPSCGPCRELVKTLEPFVEAGNPRLRFVFATSGPRDDSMELLGFIPPERVIGLDQGSAARDYGVLSTPTALLIEPSGSVIERAQGQSAILGLLKALTTPAHSLLAGQVAMVG